MSFQPVNTVIVSDRPEMQEEIKTPTTPRANALSPPISIPSNSTQVIVAGTRDINLAEQGQKPLPPAFVFPATDKSAAHTHHHDEMDVDGSDDDQDGSDNETENGDPSKPRKKRGQRFFCTDYPPCSLSFTRSEHLARHIRKHTGERPFQCHCNRRFSRLDNLRQHAQTVHVNEDIPVESLAATGVRYQRQIRTEKLRPAGRARSGTLGSQGGHSRGHSSHSRNHSTSSIGSIASAYSATDGRRPPPLLMADTMRPSTSDRPTTPTHYRTYSTNSPSGMTTPTSATYSTNPGSPAGYGSFVESPGNSRPGSFYGRTSTPARRLSVPASANIFQYNPGQGQSYMSPPLPSGSTFSNQSSTFASPTVPGFRFSAGMSLAGDDRRNTWHPPSHRPTYTGPNFSRPLTSGLSISQTPDSVQAPLAPHTPASSHQGPRLPGIESFDRVGERPSTPPRRQPSPMQVDTPPRNLFPSAANFSRPTPPVERKGHISWDGSSQTRFGGPIFANTHREVTSWSQQPHESQRLSNPPIIHQAPTSHPPQPVQSSIQQSTFQSQPQPDQQPATPSRKKRLGWYNGPLSNQTRRSPEDSSSSEGVPTPGTSAAEFHPAIVNSNGFIEPHHPGMHDAHTGGQNQRPGYFPGQAESHDMGRLEALVAVATSEDKASAVAR